MLDWNHYCRGICFLQLLNSRSSPFLVDFHQSVGRFICGTSIRLSPALDCITECNLTSMEMPVVILTAGSHIHDRLACLPLSLVKISHTLILPSSVQTNNASIPLRYMPGYLFYQHSFLGVTARESNTSKLLTILSRISVLSLADRADIVITHTRAIS